MGGVSVIIPAYRAEATIGRAVASLLAQSWQRWEALIVADDGADYAALLTAEGLDDSRLRFLSTGRIAAGAPAARNIALAAAVMPLIAPLDADDLYHPHRLETLVPLAERHGAAADNVAVVREHDGAALGTLFPPSGGVRVLDADGFLATSVPLFLMVDRRLCPPWPEDMRFSDDVVFNLRVLERTGRLPVALAPLYEYRQRDGSITVGDDAAERADRDYRRMLDRLDHDGLGLDDAGLRRRTAAAIQAKRALNAAFSDAQRAGRVTTFQEYLASCGKLCAAPRPGA